VDSSACLPLGEVDEMPLPAPNRTVGCAQCGRDCGCRAMTPTVLVVRAHRSPVMCFDLRMVGFHGAILLAVF
jgi:hypothetical protein